MTATSDLIGPALDAWVARAEGYAVEPRVDGRAVCVVRPDQPLFRGFIGYIGGEHVPQWSPSTDPAQGQPIMERECISSAGNYLRDGSGRLPDGKEWICAVRGGVVAVGPTMLVAGMRCRVAQVYGATVPAEEHR